jgi:hypothetical protein
VQNVSETAMLGLPGLLNELLLAVSQIGGCFALNFPAEVNESGLVAECKFAEIILPSAQAHLAFSKRLSQ